MTTTQGDQKGQSTALMPRPQTAGGRVVVVAEHGEDVLIGQLGLVTPRPEASP